jgi:hypothetical protein
VFSKYATKKDIKFILSNLRQEDKEELIAKYGDSWKKRTYSNIRNLGNDCLLALSAKKEPVLLYGIVPCENNIGVIWVLSVKNIENEKINFLKQTKKFVNDNLKKYSMLCNFVHAKNKSAIAWIKWLGFEIESPEIIGLGSKKFLFFFKESNNV